MGNKDSWSKRKLVYGGAEMINPELEDDNFDEDGELEVDEYPILPGLREAWAEITKEEKDSQDDESEQ